MCADPVEEFFKKIEGRPEMLPKRISGSIRIDLETDDEIEHWYIEMHEGNLHVSRDARDADCVLRAARETFKRMVVGEENLQAAAYRTEVVVEGSFPFIAQMRKLLPGPPGAHDPREFVRLTHTGSRQ